MSLEALLPSLAPTLDLEQHRRTFPDHYVLPQPFAPRPAPPPPAATLSQATAAAAAAVTRTATTPASLDDSEAAALRARGTPGSEPSRPDTLTTFAQPLESSTPSHFYLPSHLDDDDDEDDSSNAS